MTSTPAKYSLSLRDRQKVAEDTIERSDAITFELKHEGATSESTFFKNQMPELSNTSCPALPPTTIEVINADAFTVARGIMRENFGARGKTAVLNLASDEERGGGWEYTLSKTQEEALCYSSTLYSTLKSQYYPWPNLGPGSVAGIFSPGVVIFKDDLDHGCVDLDPSERRLVSVITVAAPCGPDLTPDEQEFESKSDLEDLRGKIRLVYRMAAHHGQQYIVLGAMGCGAYHCPPKLVAEEMKAALLEPEFKGWFRRVVFAVYSNPKNGPGNFEVFKDVFEGVSI